MPTSGNRADRHFVPGSPHFEKLCVVTERHMAMKRCIPAFAALALVAAGCSSTGTVDGPVLTSRSELVGQSGGMGAEVTGVLVYDEPSNCLLVELEEILYPIVWPAGTRWLDDPPGVVLKGGVLVEPGMTFHGGGGYLQAEQIEEMTGPVVAAAAARCAGPTGEIAFFNVESEVELVDS